MHSARELIQKKRDGQILSATEILSFVEGVSSLTVSDSQIAAFAMATWFRGMTVDEQLALTLAMRDSGKVLSWRDLDGPVLDKHSTGGVGDLVSLLLGPVVSACGAYVPMISGRGLGHTGGTLDKLESIPGFHTSPGIGQFQNLVRKQRIAIIGQTDDLAPADRRFYAVRDVTATIASTPLIVSSILSKKLAEGLDGLVLDIKYGSGAFTPEPAAAMQLAEEISRVACKTGVPCTALITDMDQPLAWSAGNALEVREAIRFLRGEERRDRLLEVVVSLSAELLYLGGLATDIAAGTTMAETALDSGRAAEQFARMVQGQGGPGNLMRAPDSFLPEASVIRPVYPGSEGYISKINTESVGMIVLKLGGGRHRVEDSIDPAVGISGICPLGQEVFADQPVAFIHAADDNSWRMAAEKFLEAVTIGKEPPQRLPVIYGKIDGKNLHENS